MALQVFNAPRVLLNMFNKAHQEMLLWKAATLSQCSRRQQFSLKVPQSLRFYSSRFFSLFLTQFFRFCCQLSPPIPFHGRTSYANLIKEIFNQSDISLKYCQASSTFKAFGSRIHFSGHVS